MIIVSPVQLVMLSNLGNYLHCFISDDTFMKLNLMSDGFISELFTGLDV